MAAVRVLKQFYLRNGRALFLSLLLHALLIAAILPSKFTAPVKIAATNPITTYFYSPPVAISIPIAGAETETIPTIKPIRPDPVQQEPVTEIAVAQPLVSNSSHTAMTASEPIAEVLPEPAADVAASAELSLAQRALNRAAKIDVVEMERAATIGYQQFLQAQQQPRMTVPKRHQQLSSNPKQQVLAQLQDGKHLIKTKGGCRIADPSQDSFTALMAASTIVPCGDGSDEDSTSTLLKQALEKHIKK